ncbi:MAG: hypothetical protein IJU91_03535 [Selenomonadaceae bacterium]|nr:hypothetical protein [Selenomonadaceae bacterium]
MKFIIEGTEIESFGLDEFTEQDAKKYVDYVLEHAPRHEPLEEIVVTMCDDGKVDVDYLYHGQKFERIRRITGKRIAVHN